MVYWSANQLPRPCGPLKLRVKKTKILILNLPNSRLWVLTSLGRIFQRLLSCDRRQNNWETSFSNLNSKNQVIVGNLGDNAWALLKIFYSGRKNNRLVVFRNINQFLLRQLHSWNCHKHRARLKLEVRKIKALDHCFCNEQPSEFLTSWTSLQSSLVCASTFQIPNHYQRALRTLPNRYSSQGQAWISEQG